MASTCDLTEQVRQAIKFRDERDWGQFHRPKELAAGLAIECAELQEVFLWHEGETVADLHKDKERMLKIREELGDVTIFLLLLANDMGIDLPKAVTAKLVSNANRYPVEQYRGSATKAPH